MNKTEKISDKPSRAIWFWCVGSLAFLILLVAIAIPFVRCWVRSSLSDRIQSIETISVRSFYGGDSSINDDDLINLNWYTNLTDLDISDTQITDAGLIHLKRLTNLEILTISNTQVTKEGVAELQTALPDCEIKYTPASP